MSIPRPGRLPMTLGSGRVGPGVAGHYRDRLMRAIGRVIPAIDRM